jgi:hypothetical protein
MASEEPAPKTVIASHPVREISSLVVRFDDGPTKPHECIVVKVLTTIYRAPAIHSDEAGTWCPALTFAAIEHYAHIIAVLKLSTQIFIAIQPVASDDKNQH